jgi:hypothetical protein
MKAALLIPALILSAAIQAASKSETPLVMPVVHALDQAPVLNVSQICFQKVHKDLGEAEWNKFVLKAQNRYKDWSKEFDVYDVKRFLDDKVMQLAPGVVSGKGAKLKEFACWVALYDFFLEPLPSYIGELSEDDRRTFHKELQDFDWDRCALIIKEKHENR